MQKIKLCLWFDDNAEEAVKYYTSIFKNSKIGNVARYSKEGAKASGKKEGSAMTVPFTLAGQDFLALNGGPIFKFSPAISLFVYCKTKSEVDSMFSKLSKNGEVMMPLDKYPFSERYAFFKDKFGLSWQVMLSKVERPITPCFLFVGESLGKAEAAVKFYTKTFKNTKIGHMTYYKKGEMGKAGTVMHSTFLLEGQEFMAMDGAGPHKFSFNESISFIVNCDSQKEIDYSWKKLSFVPKAEQCGWLKDQFGISWQIVPTKLAELMQNPKTANNVMKALMQMKKLDIKKLEDASKQ